MKPDSYAVLFFDGECGLCERLVRWLVVSDRGQRLRFAPLQSVVAQRYLRARGLPTEDFDSLVFVPDWNDQTATPLFRTDGALAASRLGGGRLGRALSGLQVLPRSWRDAGYKLIARWRYRIFGEAKPGGLARPEWAGRFLVD